MEFFQWAQNPWGQEILVRISWTLLWLAIGAGILFMVFHLILRRRWIAKERAAAGGLDEVGKTGERVIRHTSPARLFHWVMALAMVVLLLTGFLPVVGIKFNWVTLHWMAGLVLIASVIFHIIHATFWQSLKNVWISFQDVKDWWREMARALRGAGPDPDKPGKYPLDHKLFHHVVVVASVGVIATGILMMFRIQTPLWERNPYLLTESNWGLVYVIHGLSSVGLVALVMTHIYFAVLPEKRWLTRSMIFGWISRARYLKQHDPQRWTVGESGTAEPAEASE